MSPDLKSNRPLLDKLGVKPASKVALIDLDEPWFVEELRRRTSDITRGKSRARFDLVFYGVKQPADLGRLHELKSWIEPNGAIWVVRPKGPGTPISDTRLIEAGLAAGLVDNKIASFSHTQGAMRFVFRLKDRPR
ncbi:MAG TPA: hypothetical protein VJT78_09820 [Candidatus Dormibacteraeota bacterium]|nr:hypothetical protein [Candidatus Dormibacteraeota bacterium]